MDFYDELDIAGADPWRRVGWRRLIEQAYRFELAHEVVRQAPGVVVDFGCGVGDLSRYLAASGVDSEVIGVEVRASFAAEVPHRVIIGSYEDVEVEGACAVALGALSPPSTVDGLVAALHRAAPVFVATVLNRAALVSRALLRAEHERASVAPDYARDGLQVVAISGTDLALCHGAALRSRRQRYHATVDGPWRARFDPAERAWLACELELWDVAEEVLDAAAPSEFVDLLRERLALR